MLATNSSQTYFNRLSDGLKIQNLKSSVSFDAELLLCWSVGFSRFFAAAFNEKLAKA
jgi:hypothetical protein